jgi:hypothetical protein
LFLTQEQLLDFYKIVESRAVQDEVDRALAILSGGAEEVVSNNFSGTALNVKATPIVHPYDCVA